MRYRLCIEYAGTNYSGWQRQGHGLSIQEVLEEALEKFSGERAEIVGSGRTDAGVHALGQVAHFDLEREFPPETIVQALNYYLCEFNRTRIRKIRSLVRREFGDFYRHYGALPEQDIVVRDCEPVADDFHARFSSRMRHYRYVIINRKSASALWQHRAWHIRDPLAADSMETACQLLLGSHDFSSFRDSQCQAPSPLKTIQSCSVRREDDLIFFEIAAKSFLHHMVRNLAGTLKDVGAHSLSVDGFRDVLEARDRRRAGVNAPARGLYFVRVEY